MTISIDEVREALRSVADPCAIATGVPVDVVDMGLIADVTATDGTVTVTLRLTSPFCMQIGLMSEKIEKVLLSLRGVEHVQVEVDHLAEWWPEMMTTQARERLRRVRPLEVTAR